MQITNENTAKNYGTLATITATNFGALYFAHKYLNPGWVNWGLKYSAIPLGLAGARLIGQNRRISEIKAHDLRASMWSPMGTVGLFAICQGIAIGLGRLIRPLGSFFSGLNGLFTFSSMAGLTFSLIRTAHGETVKIPDDLIMPIQPGDDFLPRLLQRRIDLNAWAAGG